MGADVIKIEPPGRGAWERSWSGADTFIGGVSAFFMLANRNLRSVTLNLKSRRGVEVARRLVKTADVVVENFRPGVMDRLGLGYEDVRKINPRIIYAAGSGYGSDGPYSHLPGQDLLIQASSGLGANTGTEEQGPTVSAAEPSWRPLRIPTSLTAVATRFARRSIPSSASGRPRNGSTSCVPMTSGALRSTT